MILAKAVLTKQDVPNFKLGTLAEYFHADVGLEFHNSIDDVIATSRVYGDLLTNAGLMSMMRALSSMRRLKQTTQKFLMKIFIRSM